MDGMEFLHIFILGTEREAVSAGLMHETEIGASLGLPGNDGNEADVKQEDEEEQQKKRQEQIELLKKAAMYLRNRLGMNDILDGELADFQDVLNVDEENDDDTIESLSNDDTSISVDSPSANADLEVDGRQFDPFSGYMNFVISLNGDRIYTDANLTLRQQAVKMWLYLNSDAPFNGPTYDEKFLRGLLLEIFGFNNLAKFELDRTKLDFIRDVFLVRVLDDDSRMSHFEGYVQKKCNECKEKLESNQQFYSLVNK
ncbi:uncharacterized protein LOC129572288 [Sitodiplosis mosellana]|uniref:uncharacterized protein LOC129572288 n=1 Tax=Sitodiplosis mosellana TaxID=263140 RepID=UPI0024448491|nr:uncharacterized protein LOC129572288 [Sitodiplosis mosellana]